MTKAGFWLNAVLAVLGIVAFTGLAGFFGYKWLAKDEANRTYTCGTGSRGGTCIEGETINMILTFVFAGITMALIVLTVGAVRSYHRSKR